MLKFQHRNWNWMRRYCRLPVVDHFHSKVGFTDVFEAVGGYSNTDSAEWQEMVRWGEDQCGHSPFLSGEKTRWGLYLMQEQKVAVLFRRPNDALAFKMRWC